MISESASELTPSELRKHLQEILQPQALRVYRGADGLLMIRALSSEIEDVENPHRWLDEQLARRNMRLPRRSLLILKAPDEVDDEERAAFFPEPDRAFQGTPNWADALALEPSYQAGDDRDFGAPVVSFWGVKGGVGRTTALSHVATLLGRRGVHVLALDFDLDSPALLATLADVPASRAPRFEALVEDAANLELTDEDLQHRIQLALVPAREGRQVEVMGPARVDARFVQALLGPLAPVALYRGKVGALRRLVKQAVRASSADIVLIDVRSGFCEESAIAVLDLSDQVILFASPSLATYDSLWPAIEGIERHRRATGRPEQLHVVAGMLPGSEQVRSTITSELLAKCEEAREAIRQTLSTPPDELPADIEVIELDYSARIVENQGAVGMDFRLNGYSEIAERIRPSSLPESVIGVAPGWVAGILREVEIPVAQVESEQDDDVLASLFTSTAELQYFARPDVCLVLGAKGTGKSYLHRMCLTHPTLVAERSGIRSLGETIFVDGLSDPRGGRVCNPPLTTDVLRALHEQHGNRWSELWSALALARTFAQLETGALGDISDVQSTPFGALILDLARASTPKQVIERVASVMSGQQVAIELDELWEAIGNLCERKKKRLCLLFDWLDLALGDEPEWLERRAAFIRGLIVRSDMSWLSRRHLMVKLFLREDIFRRLALEETAKYENRKVELKWEEEDIWRLIIRAVAVGSLGFHAYMNDRGILPEKLEIAAEDDWRAILEVIWGERMGTDEGGTRSTVWARRRLSDGRRYLFPRAALWLLQAAFAERKAKGIDHRWEPPLLDPRSLRAAMPEVSRNRLAELRAESSPDEKGFIALLVGFDAYQNRKDFLRKLRALDVAPATAEEVLDRLEALGVVELGSRRDGTPTIRIVDLYAFAPELQINRRGRR